MRFLFAAAVAISISSGAFAAAGYKIVHPDGSVEFSDQPAPGARSVELPKSQTYRPTPVPNRRDAGSEETPDPADPPYQGIAIETPVDETTVRWDGRPLAVRVSVEPALNAAGGHEIVVAVDQVPKAVGTGPSFQLDPLERGAHRLQAWVRDSRERALIRSEPVTVYVHKPSKLFQSND